MMVGALSCDVVREVLFDNSRTECDGAQHRGGPVGVVR